MSICFIEWMELKRKSWEEFSILLRPAGSQESSIRTKQSRPAQSPLLRVSYTRSVLEIRTAALLNRPTIEIFDVRGRVVFCRVQPIKTTHSRLTVDIPKLAGGSVHYMDIYDKFLEPDGTISKEVMPDSLHLGSKGYDIWVEAISDKVKELLGEAKPAKKS